MRLPIHYCPSHSKRKSRSRPKQGNVSFELAIATMISTLPGEIGGGDRSVIYSCIKTINDYLERYSELIYAKVIAAQVDPLIIGQPKVDLEYNKFCPSSFFGGFTTWNDVPDAIKIRMCEYLEAVFPLLQVAYDNWVSKIFFAKAFGRKGRNPA